MYIFTPFLYYSVLRRYYNPNIYSKSEIISDSGTYYKSIVGDSSRGRERYEKWGEFYTPEGNYGGEFNGEYEKFYKYVKQLEGEPRTVVTWEMIESAEVDIYEEENIYQVHYATEEEGVVVGL